MSYVALYRKFRPRCFEDVKGQDAIVTTLKNQIRHERTQHAYLFCGTRGTGKTTVAKILARAVNCESPVDGNPCGKCRTCLSIAQGNSMNVIEIDAASNNGVDSIREIIEEVQYRPPTGKYKVYIIDEVHMLSTGAFNALLKTLEEPPGYVMFILATTEANKIPITILSRCQRYDFKRIDTDTIASRLGELTRKEGAETEEKALRYIARAADGSMRDGLSLLDQCLAFQTGDKLTYEQVLDVLGAVDTGVFDDLLRAVIKGDTGEALRLYERLIDNGRENGQFIADFIWYLRNVLMIRTSGDGGGLVDASPERLAELKDMASLADEGTLIRYIRLLSDLNNRLRYAANRRVLTEISLIRLTRPQMSRDDEALKDRVRILEEKLEELLSRPLTVSENRPPAEEAEDEEEVPEDETVPAAPEDLKEIVRGWDRILNELDRKFSLCVLWTRSSGKLHYNPEDKEPVLYVGYQNDMAEHCVANKEFKEAVRQTIRRLYRKDVQVDLYLTKDKRPELRSITLDEQLKQIKTPIEIEREI